MIHLTQPQINHLTDLRIQSDLNDNNYGSNSHKAHEEVKPVNYLGEIKKLGLTYWQASELTWNEILNRQEQVQSLGVQHRQRLVAQASQI